MFHYHLRYAYSTFGNQLAIRHLLKLANEKKLVDRLKVDCLCFDFHENETRILLGGTEGFDRSLESTS